MLIEIKLTEKDLRELIIAYICKTTAISRDELNSSAVRIEVKSKQNYRSEWEVADFRAVYIQAL